MALLVMDERRDSYSYLQAVIRIVIKLHGYIIISLIFYNFIYFVESFVSNIILCTATRSSGLSSSFTLYSVLYSDVSYL